MMCSRASRRCCCGLGDTINPIYTAVYLHTHAIDSCLIDTVSPDRPTEKVGTVGIVWISKHSTSGR